MIVAHIAAVRASAVVVGHLIAVLVAQDRTLEDAPPSGATITSQLPLLATMVGYTLAALLVLLR